MKGLKRRIREFDEALSDYCPGLFKSMKFNFGEYKFSAELRVKKTEHLATVNEIVEEFDDILLYAHVCEYRDGTGSCDDIAGFGFGELEKTLKLALTEFIDSHVGGEHDRNIYSLGVFYDNLNRSMAFSLSSLDDMIIKLAKKQAGTSSEFYQSNEQIEEFMYYQESSIYEYAPEPVSGILVEHRDRTDELMDRFDEAYYLVLDNHYYNMIKSLVAGVLNQMADSAARLNRTENFMSYMSFYDEDWLTHLHGLRQTASKDQILANMPAMYGRYF